MDNLPENSHRSRYGIAKLQDHNYSTWSHQCRMLLSEKKVWKVVTGDHPQPESIGEREKEKGIALTDTELKRAQKEIDNWDENNEEALRIISFTVSDPLQAPIRYGKTAQGAWDELKRVHAPNDKQRKFSLLRRLYRIDMARDGSFIDHERVFDELVQNLADIGHSIDTEELIILFANSLPQDAFGNWIQAQLAFIDGITITEFKGRVREEARRLNINGLSQTLGMDPDAVQANIARSNRIFPPRKPKNNVNLNAPKCTHCGYRNHTYDDCHKRIAEEYLAKQARKPQGGGRGRGRGKWGGNRGGKGGGNANFADANSNAGDTPAYSQIFGGLAFCSSQPPAGKQRRRRHSNRKPQNRLFGGLAFCLKAALNASIPQVGGVWTKDNGATHHMQYDKSLFSTYHRLRHRLFVGGIGSGLKAVGVGDIKITDRNGTSRILKGVLHVPQLKCGLMSLNTLALDDINSTITRHSCTVSDGVFNIHSPIKNGLCVWSQYESHSKSDSEMGGHNALFAAIAQKKTSLTDLHERLGHYSKNSLLKHGENAIADLNIDPTERTTTRIKFHASHASSANMHGARFLLVAASGPSPSNPYIRILRSPMLFPTVMANTLSRSLTMQLIKLPSSSFPTRKPRQSSTPLRISKPGRNVKASTKSKSCVRIGVPNTWVR
jgi:hypothetical protein